VLATTGFFYVSNEPDAHPIADSPHITGPEQRPNPLGEDRNGGNEFVQKNPTRPCDQEYRIRCSLRDRLLQPNVGGLRMKD